MVKEKQRILIVEANLDLADVLTAYFHVQGYDTTAVHCGEEAILASQKLDPDLIILDTLLGDIDGYEVARRIRADERDIGTPIIFIFDDSDIHKTAVDEFIADIRLKKPVSLHDLRVQVIESLIHAQQDIYNNRVTGLPEGALVEEQLGGCLLSNQWAIMRISLNNWDAYRDCYGPRDADDVLHMIAYMVRDTVDTMGGQEDFLGHLYIADLVLITEKARSSELREKILTRLVQSLEYFYPIQDRDRNKLAGKRLNIKIKTLQASDGDFSSLDILKSSILDN